MAATDQEVVHSGVQCPAPEAWKPFEWEEPGKGPQRYGEVTIARAFGRSGRLSAGFWRTAPGHQANEPASQFVYSSPLGDETACVIDGNAVLTVIKTGQSHNIGPGTIVSTPKGLEVEWHILDPFFKKFWCIWDGTNPVTKIDQNLQLNHISDNPEKWDAYKWTEPKAGPLVAGELYTIRSHGSTGFMHTGIWRGGKGLPATRMDENGTAGGLYTAVLGDETILLLEGEVDVTELESGKKQTFRAGDIIGLTTGMEVTWVAKGPFCKKIFIITRDELPS